MALITSAQRDQLQALFIGMFEATPGAEILSQTVTAFEAGASLSSIAAALASKPQFEAVYPAHLTSSEFADHLIGNLLPSTTPAAAQTWSKNWIIGKLNAGETRAEVIATAIIALTVGPGTTNPAYADAHATLENKVAVSNYYTVTAQQPSTNLAALQAVLSGVTADPATVTAAIAAIDGGITSETIRLTNNKDTLTGAAGTSNDVFEALTIDANGNAANTFNPFDFIDGGAGRDTLNIFTTAALNNVAGATVKNVEVVNIINTVGSPAAALADASLYQGVEQLWQVNDAANVAKLAAGVTAGFRNVDSSVTVTPTNGAASAAIALDSYGETNTLTVDGTASTALASVTVSGTVADTNADDTVGQIGLAVTVGKDVQALAVNTAVDLVLGVAANGKNITSVDASASTGGVEFTGAATSVASIKSGAGDDTLELNTATSATISATLSSGAGKDTIEVHTTGKGTTTVDAGAGDDAVTVSARSDGKLTVNLGAGNDTFDVAGAVVQAGDDINGGDGVDTLLLSIVGAANIGAFSNFEVFDAVGLAKNLDVDILASKNTVTEIITTGDVGVGASLSNLGAGVGYRITGDTNVANGLTLTQKTAGAITIGLDIDETVAATTGATSADGYVIAANSTSITAAFDADFIDKSTGGADNTAALKIDGAAATTLTVTSGGDNAANTLVYTDTGVNKLATVTVTGGSALNLDLSGSNKVATVDASAHTGGLTFNLNDLKAGTTTTSFDGGLLTVGAGKDVITVFNGAKVAGFGKGTVENATTQGNFDVLKGAGQQAADATNADVKIENGLATFLGAGPNDLATAIATVTALTGANESAVFQYLGNSYIVDNDGAAVVQLVGVTGLTGLDTVNGVAGDLYVF